MSNKTQINCNRSNKFIVWYIKHLEERLKTQYSELKVIDQKIKNNNEEAIDYSLYGIPWYQIPPDTFVESNKEALERARSIIYSSYQNHCKQIRRYKGKLCIC